MKEFYQFKMYPEESGVALWLNKFFSFHETECYHYCLPELMTNCNSSVFLNKGESMAQSLKRRGVKFYKIHKTCSRKAFDTKEKAYANFLFLKKRQLAHLQRDIEMVKIILKFSEDSKFSDLKDLGHCFELPNTQDFIASNYVFD